MNPWLDLGRVRLDAFLSYSHGRFPGSLACPDDAPETCAAQDVDAITRVRTVDWLQLDPTVNVGLGKGFQIAVTLPVQLQVLSSAYRVGGARIDLGTDPADPASSVVGGLADGRVMGWGFGRVGEGWVLGGGIGFTVPTGRPPTDPFLPGSSDTPQPYRSGSGTVDPVAGLMAVGSGRRWGGLVAASARVPVYAWRRTYRAPFTVGLGVGPSVRVVPAVQLLLTAEATVSGQAQWRGVDVGGQATLGGQLAVFGTVSPSVVVQGRVGGAFAQWAFTATDAPTAPVVQASVGVSWTSTKKHPPP